VQDLVPSRIVDDQPCALQQRLRLVFAPSLHSQDPDDVVIWISQLQDLIRVRPLFLQLFCPEVAVEICSPG
jgi:hypothetical protein